MAAVVPKAVKGRNCSVPQCGSVAFRSRGCSFHTFPRTGQLVTVMDQHGFRVRVERRALWAQVLCLGREVVSKSMCVCSKHFDSYDFNALDSERRRLKQTAIPSRNLPVFFPRTKGEMERLPPLLPRPSGTRTVAVGWTRGEEHCRPVTEIEVEHDLSIDIKEEPIDESIDSPPSETIETPVEPEFVKVEAVEHWSEAEVGEEETEPGHFVDIGDFLEVNVEATTPAVMKTEPPGSCRFLCRTCTMGYSTAAFLQLHQETCRKWKTFHGTEETCIEWETFSDAEEICRKWKTFNDTTGPAFLCQWCPLAFSAAVYLKHHQKRSCRKRKRSNAGGAR